MSWGVSAIGKPAAVAAKLADDFSKITYLQGEEALVKDAAATLVANALAGFTGDYAVDVSASGHASTSGESKAQTVNISIRPLYGFVE